MRAKKQRRRVNEETSENVLPDSKPSELLNIRFNTSRQNLACFIGEKIVRKTRRVSENQRKRKPSRQKPIEKAPKVQLPLKSLGSPAYEDILKESLDSVIRQIQNKGISCAWGEVIQASVLEESEEQREEANKIWTDFTQAESNRKSYASTIDYYTPYYETFASPYQFEYRQASSDTSLFVVRANNIGMDPRTTIMIRNIPNKYTIRELAEEVDLRLANTYDFLYLPCDTMNQCNVGYGFINFLNTDFLKEFYRLFHNYRWAKFRSEKICVLTYARLQGLDSLIEHFQNSKVLNQKDKKYRPIIKEYARIEHLIKKQQLGD